MFLVLANFWDQKFFMFGWTCCTDVHAYHGFRKEALRSTLCTLGSCLVPLHRAAEIGSIACADVLLEFKETHTETHKL